MALLIVSLLLSHAISLELWFPSHIAIVAHIAHIYILIIIVAISLYSDYYYWLLATISALQFAWCVCDSPHKQALIIYQPQARDICVCLRMFRTSHEVLISHEVTTTTTSMHYYQLLPGRTDHILCLWFC